MNTAAVVNLLKELNQEFKQDNDKATKKLRYVDVDFADSKFAVELTNNSVTGIFCDGDLRYLLKPEIERIISERTIK